MEFFYDKYHYQFVRLAGTKSLFTPQRFEAEVRKKPNAEEPDEDASAEDECAEDAGEMSQGCKGDD